MFRKWQYEIYTHDMICGVNKGVKGLSLPSEKPCISSRVYIHKTHSNIISSESGEMLYNYLFSSITWLLVEVLVQDPNRLFAHAQPFLNGEAL